MADARQLRTALAGLHRELLEAQRREAEKIGGRMSRTELLQAAADDLRFDWLRTLSTLIVELDDGIREDDRPGVEAAVDRARALLDPPDQTTAFGARYLSMLQTQPAVVMAHRDVTAALR